jgi:translocator protein
MIPSWLMIGVVTFLAALVSNRLQSKQDFRWFLGLRRPRWLTFEGAIPLIWILILLCGVGSATFVWESSQHRGLMVGYLFLEQVILAYTWVMGKFRRLRVGVIIGAAGFGVGCWLAILVWPVSNLAFFLLLPYLLWSPVGTFVTWQMMALNPSDV